MSGTAVVIAAELRQHDGAAELIGLENVFFEVDVQALGLTDLLIVPAGGVVDGARWVCVCNLFGDSCSVELSPALVERYPHCNARAIVQKLDHFIELGFVFHAAFEILAREELVVFVADVNAGDERG